MIQASNWFLERQALLVRVSILGGPLTPIHWHLFVNDLEPDQTTPLSAFVEASWGGYSPRPNIQWQPPVLIDGEWITTSAGLYSWGPSAGGSGPIYGWYSVLSSGPDSLWLLAERFENAPIVLEPFQILTVLPSKGDRPWAAVG